MMRNAADLGMSLDLDDFDPALLAHEREGDCSARSPSSRGSWRAPPSCASRTGSRATSRTPPSVFHKFYDTCRVLPQGDEPVTPVNGPGSSLVAATRTVFANGLDLLGVCAPERM